MKPHVLIVEPPEAAGGSVAPALAGEGAETATARGVAAAVRALRERRWDLVLLDVDFADGLQLCRRVRLEWDVPIVLLAADAREADRVLALDLGADDVVAKPLSIVELAARIRAILRRGRSAYGRTLEIGDIRLDPAAHRVTKAGRPVPLAPRQFDLLHILMRNAGAVVRRDRIMTEVWDLNWFGSTKTLDVHVSGLRKKLGDDSAAPRYIHTVRGVGFMFGTPEGGR